MKARLAGSLALAAALLLGACSNDTADKLVVTGSSTLAPLTAELAGAYEATHPGVEIDVQSGGSSRGIGDTRNGLADLGMVSRPLASTESDLQAHTVALDGIALINHRDNPVDALSHDQVVAIYTGQIENWSQLGGPDRRMTVVNKAGGHSTLELFLKHFGLSRSALKSDVVIGDNQQGIKTVAGNPWAIAYVSIGSAEFEASQGQAIQLVTLDRQPASVASLKQGDYPLSRPLNFVTGDDISPLAQRFLDFVHSDQAHAFIEKYYFIPAGQ